MLDPCKGSPFPPNEVDELLRQAQLPNLLYDRKPSKLKQKAKEGGNTVVYKQVKPKMILCGRGATISSHSGNDFFRKVILVNQDHYNNLHRSEKKFAAEALLSFFESIGMVFVENPEVETLLVSSVGFRESSYERVHEKIMQSLRQKVKPPIRNKVIARLRPDGEIDVEVSNGRVEKLTAKPRDKAKPKKQKEVRPADKGARSTTKTKPLPITDKPSSAKEKSSTKWATPATTKKRPAKKSSTTKPLLRRSLPKTVNKKTAAVNTNIVTPNNSSTGRKRPRSKQQSSSASSGRPMTKTEDAAIISDHSPPRAEESSSSEEATTPILLQGSFEHCVPAKVPCLATFLSTKINTMKR